MRSAFILILGLMVAIAGVSRLAAQSTTGTISGTVTRSDGAPVGDAVIQARSHDTGSVRSAVTNSKGHYRVGSLALGAWTVAVRLEDGRISRSQIAQVRLQETAIVDFVSDPSVVEKITVTAEPLVDPKQTAGRLLVTADQISRVPLSGRVFTDLAKLDSSVGSAGGGVFFGERGAAFSVNGQGGRTNTFLVDGLDNNDSISGTNLNTFYSQQVIREFTLMTDQYAPEYGRASGGVLNIVTRQGANQPGWSAFAQATGGPWNDPGEFVESLPDTGASQDALSRYQLGFNLHGAFKKDRAFYFLAYERQGTNRVVPYTGVTRDGVAGGSIVADSDDDNIFFRTDYNIGSDHTLMVRLTYDERGEEGVNVGGVRTPDNGFDFEEQDLDLAGSLKSVISPGLVNEARFMIAGSRFDQLAASDQTEVTRPSGVFGGNTLNLQSRDESRLQLVDNLTLTRGSHTMKFGVDVAWSSVDVRTEFNPNGGLIYDVDRPFVFGDLRTYPVVFLLVDGVAEETLEDTRLALFAQDSWSATRRLHLNFGLRYDLSTFTLDEDARVDSTVPNGGAGRDYDNLAPRVGFTFSPRVGGSLVLWGGAGIFYDKLVLAFPAASAVTSQTEIGFFFPQGFQAPLTEDLIEEIGIDDIADSVLNIEAFSLRFSTATELETPYTVQYNLGFDLATGRKSVLRANAVRALGYHVPLMKDLNPVSGLISNGVECNAGNIDPDGLIPCHLADPTTGSIAAITTEGRSWYWAVDTSWRWRGQRGSWFSVSYTLSRAEDLGFDPLKDGVSLPPDSTNLEGERGRSDSDQRHRSVVSGDIGLGVLGLRTSGVVQYASGAPFNVTTGQDNNLDGILTDRPEGVRRNTGEDTPLDALNAFRVAEGLEPVQGLEEPDFLQVDLRLYRRFPFSDDRGTGEVFLQVFNLLNRQNVGLIEGRAAAGNFGQVVALGGPPRTVELGLRFGY